jgi:hypothetical protein
VRRFAASLAAAALACVAVAAEPHVNGDAVIRGPAGGSEIVVRTTDRLAGAIDSLTWGGKEFIDSVDHGRQLQSACSFGTAGRGFWAECYNPTEAGSRDDGAGPKSSSRLLKLHAAGRELSTTSRMAFWLAPGEKSSGRPARNDTALSNVTLSKRVAIGTKSLPNVLEYQVAFTVPPAEKHTYAQFEVLTGYMPATFARFWAFDTKTGRLAELTDGPGEQAKPVVFSDADGSHAMGVFTPDRPAWVTGPAGYGRWRFTPERVVKWNCVFRATNPAGIPAGDYRVRLFIPVGTLEDVRKSLVTLSASD